ncbi:MAG: hypothetical protein OXK76_12595 [Gammaproteobacteria bacterium]|nr:hypothetical protein [Gammaproteobacteria bacterium]
MRRDSPVLPWARTLGLLLLLSLLAVAVTAPRFNRVDWLVGNLTSDGKDSAVHLGDAANYVSAVQWFRGKAGLYGEPGAPGEEVLRAPFCYRVVVPALAAVLPFSPMTAINTLNLLFVIGAMLLLYRLERLLAVPERDALLGCALFVVSFPTFYYSTIGYIDPVLVFAVIACLNLIYDRRHLAAALTIGFGLLAKENIVMVIPALAVGVWQTTHSWRVAAAWTILAFGIWTVLWFAVRSWVPVLHHAEWHMNLATLEYNMLRARSWLTLALCAATVVLPFVRMRTPLPKLRRRAMDPLWLPMWAGLAGSTAHYAYSWLVAYADGRMFWPIFCFAIPIAIHLTTRERERCHAA